MKRIVKLVFATVAVAAVVAGALSYPPLQDRLVDRAIRKQMDNSKRQALFADDALRLLVCGSSSPFPSEDRARPCLAVIAGGKFYAVDTGPGSWNRLALLRIPGDRIGGVMFTHFHSDHIGDLGEFNMQTWVAGRSAPLQVYGPEGVSRIVAGYSEAYALDNGYRVAHHGTGLLDLAKGQMQAQTLALSSDGSPTVFLEDSDLKVSVFAVSHAPISPSVGYRFDYKGRSLVISGDTIKDAHLIAAAKGADLLVHEAQNQELVARLRATAGELGLQRMHKVFGDIPDYHTSPVEAAQSANEAGVPLLLMYHLTPPPANRFLERIFLRGVSDVRKDGVALARDGMLIEIPLAGGAAKISQLR